MSKETFKFTKEMLSNTRQTMNHYISTLTEPEDKREVITVLKAKLSLDQLRQFAYEFGIEKEAENFNTLQNEVEVEMNVEMNEEFIPMFEEVLEEKFEPSFEPLFEPSFEKEEKTQEFELEVKENDNLDITRADYFGVSIAIRDVSLKKEIELKGVKEVKRANESIVEFAKDLAKKIRQTKKDLGIVEDRENGF